MVLLPKKQPLTGKKKKVLFSGENKIKNVQLKMKPLIILAFQVSLFLTPIYLTV